MNLTLVYEVLMTHLTVCQNQGVQEGEGIGDTHEREGKKIMF